MKYESKKYEFDKKSNLQVHWLFEIEISFIDKMAFSYYIYKNPIVFNKRGESMISDFQTT